MNKENLINKITSCYDYNEFNGDSDLILLDKDDVIDVVKKEINDPLFKNEIIEKINHCIDYNDLNGDTNLVLVELDQILEKLGK